MKRKDCGSISSFSIDAPSIEEDKGRPFYEVPMFRFCFRLFLVLFSFNLSAAFALDDASNHEFTSLQSYLASDDSRSAAYSKLQTTLVKDFDFICPDTFCEGEFNKIQSSRWECSVNKVTEKVDVCEWEFAASAQYVDPTSGKVTVEDSRVITCKLDINAPLTEVLTLHLTTDEGGPDYNSTLGRRLSSNKTIFEMLMNCF